MCRCMNHEEICKKQNDASLQWISFPVSILSLSRQPDQQVLSFNATLFSMPFEIGGFHICFKYGICKEKDISFLKFLVN